MRKTYRSSNVRFCMEDENQRRTWEYLQTLTRKDCSYGKALSDAFVQVLDERLGAEKNEEPDENMTDRIEKSIAEQLSKMQMSLMEQIESSLERYTFQTVSEEAASGGYDETGQVAEIAMSDAMMSMALAMGDGTE